MLDKTFIEKLFTQWDLIFQANIETLTELDSVGGDGDLGIVMGDGFKAADQFVHDSMETDLGKLFYQAGKCFNNAASSSMGTLLSSGFMNIGQKLKGKTALANEELLLLVREMAAGVKQTGKAEEGEKTFLDAIYPAARSIEANLTSAPIDFLTAGYQAACQGVDDAAKMEAKHGRLAFRKADSIGIIDPGTVVAKLYVEGLLKTIASEQQ